MKSDVTSSEKRMQYQVPAVSDPMGVIGAITPTKTYESNFIRHDLFTIRKTTITTYSQFIVYCFVQSRRHGRLWWA